MRIVISLGFCGMILMSVEANIFSIRGRLFEIVIWADFLSLLLFLDSGRLGKMMGVKVGWRWWSGGCRDGCKSGGG